MWSQWCLVFYSIVILNYTKSILVLAIHICISITINRITTTEHQHTLWLFPICRIICRRSETGATSHWTHRYKIIVFILLEHLLCFFSAINLSLVVPHKIILDFVPSLSTCRRTKRLLSFCVLLTKVLMETYEHLFPFTIHKLNSFLKCWRKSIWTEFRWLLFPLSTHFMGLTHAMDFFVHSSRSKEWMLESPKVRNFITIDHKVLATNALKKITMGICLKEAHPCLNLPYSIYHVQF